MIVSAALVLAATLMSNSAFSQAITVNQAATDQEVRDYVENVLLGSCVTASNITYSGAARSAGTFDGTGSTDLWGPGREWAH